MRVLLQRVKSSRVEVNGQVIGAIQQGLNLLVGIAQTDTDAELDWMARKVLDLRVFSDELGRLAQSVLEIQGEILVVSQFTLYGDCRKGRRPSFDRSAPGTIAESLFHQFVERLVQSGLKVETGKFAAMMQVFIENDGPVTLMLEREAEDRRVSGG
jgi:D-aminoacyl-tRNA deacylase